MVWTRDPGCVHPHFKNQPCPQRLCDTDETSEPTDKAKAREDVSDAGEQSPEPRRSRPSRGGKRVVESPKVERIEAAKSAIDEGIRKEALSSAQRQARYRANNLERVREREAERKRRKRQEQKDG